MCSQGPSQTRLNKFFSIFGAIMTSDIMIYDDYDMIIRQSAAACDEQDDYDVMMIKVSW